MTRVMKRLVVGIVALTACTSSTVNNPGSAAVVPAGGRTWADSVLASLSLRDKAAQMVWPTVLGDYTSGDSPQWQRLTDYIRKDKVGGFTISVGSPTEVASKLNALQEMSTVPLVFGADLEAGAGFRARGGYFIPNAIDLGGAAVFPPEMAIGATGDTTLAFEQGRLTAIEGRALGIHIAYAPVLDVNNNPANPVINTRSYGEDPALAARLGSAFIRGVQTNGMIATGKHFPGHGDTGTNSHLALPVVTVSRNRLDSVELVPFRAAVNSGVGAIMSFHARALASNVRSFLVVACAEVDGLAQFSIARPFAELHFDDHFRLHPVCPLVCLRNFLERGLALFEWREPAMHLRESRASESSARVADVDKPVTIIVAEEEGADVLP